MHALLSDSEKDELFYAHYSSFTLPVTYFFLLLFSWQIIKVVHENILIRPWVSLAFDVRFSGKRNCVSEIEGKKESVLDNAIYSCLSFLFIFPEINLLNKLRACVAKKYRTQLRSTEKLKSHNIFWTNVLDISFRNYTLFFFGSKFRN